MENYGDITTFNKKVLAPYQKPEENVKKVLHGDAAVAKVVEMEGRSLTPIEERVVRLEGFVDGAYKDTKGITTYGVGQTGKYMGMPFSVVLKLHEDATRRLVPSYDKLPEKLRGELVQATYRGDLGNSPKAVAMFNSGLYKQAANEFLNNDEYESLDTPESIKVRMADVSSAMLDYNPDMESTVPSLKEYIVKAGDSLYQIAKDTGKSVSSLADDNGITDPSAIKPGQKLFI